MTSGVWIPVLLASLAGSVHCAAMCGGFVAAYASGEPVGPLERALSHVAYNGGRLVTYLGLGAAAGAVGRALDLAGSALGLAHLAALVTAVVVAVSVVVELLPRVPLVRLRRGPSRNVAGLLTPLFRRFRDRPAALRALLLGLSSTLLPCGWLYAFAALAAGTGTALGGAWLMSAFWLGSVPLMLGLGLSLGPLTRRLGAYLPRLRPLLVLAVGAATLFSRLQLPAFAATRAGHPARSAAVMPSPDDCVCHPRVARAPAAAAPAREVSP